MEKERKNARAVDVKKKKVTRDEKAF